MYRYKPNCRQELNIEVKLSRDKNKIQVKIEWLSNNGKGLSSLSFNIDPFLNASFTNFAGLPSTK